MCEQLLDEKWHEIRKAADTEELCITEEDFTEIRHQSTVQKKKKERVTKFTLKPPSVCGQSCIREQRGKRKVLRKKLGVQEDN